MTERIANAYEMVEFDVPRTRITIPLISVEPGSSGAETLQNLLASAYHHVQNYFRNVEGICIRRLHLIWHPNSIMGPKFLFIEVEPSARYATSEPPPGFFRRNLRRILYGSIGLLCIGTAIMGHFLSKCADKQNMNWSSETEDQNM